MGRGKEAPSEISEDLYDFVILGEHSIMRTAGCAYHPSGQELQSTVDSFFEKAQQGQEAAKNVVRKFKQGYLIFTDPSPLETAIKLRQALRRGDLSEKQIPDIRQGFKGILVHDPKATEPQKQLAQTFTRSLFPQY